MGSPVVLSVLDQLEAAAIGYERTRRAVERAGEPRHRNGSLWGGSIEGACAELVVARWLVLPWTGKQLWTTPPTESIPDVGEATEVRWIAPAVKPYLYIDAGLDKPDRYFVLVQGHAPKYEILGWIKGERGMQKRWLHRYPERLVYRVPAAELAYLPPR